jgi:hypothetical protein
MRRLTGPEAFLVSLPESMLLCRLSLPLLELSYGWWRTRDELLTVGPTFGFPAMAIECKCCRAYCGPLASDSRPDVCILCGLGCPLAGYCLMSEGSGLNMGERW